MRKQWVVVGVLAGTLLAGDALAQHKTPNQQPTTAESPAAPTGEIALGTARLTKGVTADGKALPAGTYQVRVTAQESKPDAVGTTEQLERWVEFLGTFAKGGRYELKSHSGNVRVTVAGGSGFAVEANSWSGTVHSDFSLGGSDTEATRGRRKVLRGVVGDGSAVVSITTFSGNVQLLKK